MDTIPKGLIDCAVKGDQRCMNELISSIQPKVRAYIMRCTLNEDLTEDLLQETMLQMVTSLPSLKNYKRFWPWLYRIAYSKIIDHFRRSRRRSAVPFSSLQDRLLDSVLKDDKTEVSYRPILKEMGEIVTRAIGKMNPRQRAILSLRCFENMPYSQIAESVGCSETTVRVHFHRARKKLRSNLKAQGISGTALLTAMVLFGKSTAGKAMAGTVTSASVAVDTGMTATEAFLLTLKTKLIAGGSAAAILVSGGLIWSQLPSKFPDRNMVSSVHYVVQGVGLLSEQNDPISRRSKGNTDSEGYFSKGSYEQWLHFPKGPDGPVLVRMQRWSIDQKVKLCGWLQDGTANYYYHSGENTIYLTNDPIGMLILPTDPPELVEFIQKYTKHQTDVEYRHDRKKDLMTTKIDNRIMKYKNYTTRYEYNTLSESDFIAFWPEDVKVIDERDPMHQRGWTHFTFDGTIGDFDVSGKGQMPLCYLAYEHHRPWLEMTIGGSLQIIDTSDGAIVKNLESGKTTRYPSGTFFAGLGRPWCGIRAYDMLRRDAAKDRIPFYSKRVKEKGMIVLQKESGYTNLQIVYHIDMGRDTIEEIAFSRSDQISQDGKLIFSYSQEPRDLATGFEIPILPESIDTTPVQSMKHWQIWLMEQIPAIKKTVLK